MISSKLEEVLARCMLRSRIMGRRTVAPGGGLVVEVVAHNGGGLVEELCDLGVGFVLEALGEEVGVVAAACLDQELLDGGALCVLVIWYVCIRY